MTTSFLTRLLFHQDMASALLEDEDLNVIRVNWGRGARTAYHQATANIRMVDLFLAVVVVVEGVEQEQLITRQQLASSE